MNISAIPDSFGLFPFSGAYTADEFRTFFAWCSAHGVSDVDLVGGSPVSVSRYGRRERVSDTILPNIMLGNMLDDLLGPEVRPRVQGGRPLDRAIQIDGDMHGDMAWKGGNACGYARTSSRGHLPGKKRLSPSLCV